MTDPRHMNREGMGNRTGDQNARLLVHLHEKGFISDDRLVGYIKFLLCHALSLYPPETREKILEEICTNARAWAEREDRRGQ